MRHNILIGIEGLEDYRTVLEAVSGEKQEFTDEEAQELLRIYEENAERCFGTTGPEIVKAVLVLDVTQDMEHPASASGLSRLLDEADKACLDMLSALCMSYNKPELAVATKDSVLSGDMSQWLRLALTRAALDVLASQKNISAYQEEVNALASTLTAADEKLFTQASRFLVMLRDQRQEATR